MHLFYENIAPYMLKHWMGSFFKDSTLNDQPYRLNIKQWNDNLLSQKKKHHVSELEMLEKNMKFIRDTLAGIGKK